MKYIERIADSVLEKYLRATGAVLIRGPKACGKTETARRVAKSEIILDARADVGQVMATDPRILLEGKTPRLIDEWQVEKNLWNYIRHEVDARKEKGQFILTGSANPEEDANMHSGAGRFSVINLSTLTWLEMGHSDGMVSLKQLLQGTEVKPAFNDTVSLDLIIERLLKGGWPALYGMDPEAAEVVNRGYCDYLAEVDMSRISSKKRDPLKVRAIIRSIARNIASQISSATISRDASLDDTGISKPTVLDYLDALERVMILENQPAFNAHVRSAAALTKSPKRHLADSSIAAAALGLGKEDLKADLMYTGLLFESLAYHEIKAYAQPNFLEVSFYRDSYDNEVDIIVSENHRRWAAFEVKLGAGSIDEAAEKLIRFKNNIDTTKMAPPRSLNIITGTGFAHTRKDGVNVVPLQKLGV